MTIYLDKIIINLLWAFVVLCSMYRICEVVEKIHGGSKKEGEKYDTNI